MNIQAALVRSILERFMHYDWTVQGFGFVRTKIADVGRIHIWDSSLAIPYVSTAHTHPWPLFSTIISGELINHRFAKLPEDASIAGGVPYMHSRLKTGEGGMLCGESERVVLSALGPCLYTSGSAYSQEPGDIHRTIAEPGTVTLLERPQGPPLEEASVFWPVGTEWVSAEPRPISFALLGPVVDYALQRWVK